MEFLRLKEILSEKGITGKDLAVKVGVTENALSLIVNGKRQPRFELLMKIADTLEVDIKDLFQSSTASPTNEPLYIIKDGKPVKIGEIDLLSSL